MSIPLLIYIVGAGISYAIAGTIVLWERRGMLILCGTDVLAIAAVPVLIALTWPFSMLYIGGEYYGAWQKNRLAAQKKES